MSTAFIRATATPAPWKVAHSGYANSPFVIYSGDKTPDFSRRFPLSGIHAIAEIFHDEGPDHEQQKADAALISQAPALARFVLDQMFALQCICKGPIGRVQTAMGTDVKCHKCEAEEILKKAGVIL
jgi:hypothetical protein